MADVRNSLPGVGVFLLIFFGLVIGCAVVWALLYIFVPKLLRGLGWLLWQPFRFPIWILTLIFVPIGEALEPVRRWWQRAWTGIRRFVSDSKALIKAFLKAKKERVCPFLTVVTAHE